MADLATLSVEVKDDGSINITSKELRKLTQEAGTTAKAIDGLENANEKLVKKNKNVNNSILEMSSSFKIAGRDLSRFITLPLLAAGAASFKFGSDLNEGLGLVETLLPETVGRIDELKEATKELAVDSGKGFADLTEGLYQTVSAFQDGVDTVDRFNTVTKAAVAGNASVRSSLELLSAVTKGYDDTSAEAVDSVADLAFEAIRLGQTTFPELASSIQKVTSLSSTLAVSQEELFSVFATLTGVTGDAAAVSTQYRSVLASLFNPTETLQKLFAQMGVSSGEAAIEQNGLIGVLKAIADSASASGIPLQKYIRRVEGITAVNALAGAQLDTFIDKFDEISDASGAADDAFKATTEGINKFGFQLKQAQERLAVVSSEVYDQLIPGFTSLINTVANIADVFTNMDTVTQSVILGLLGLTAALGPLSIAFGSGLRLVKLFADLMATTFAASLTGVGIAFVALAAIVGIYSAVVGNARKKQEEFNESLSVLSSKASARVGVLNDMKEEFDSLTNSQGINLELNERLIERFPALGNIIDENTTKVSELDMAFKRLNAQAALKEAPSIYASQIEEAQEFAEKLRDTEDRLNLYRESVKVFQNSIKEGLDAGDDVEALRDELALIEGDVLREGEAFKFFKTAIEDIADAVDLTANVNGIDAYFSRWGIGFREFIEEADKAKTELPGADPIVLSAQAKSTGIKEWEEWFADITGVTEDRFSDVARVFDKETGKLVSETFTGRGREAGEAFIADLEKAISDKSDLASVFGEKIDYGDALEGLISSSETAILSLLKLRDEQIADSEAFSLLDNSIKSQTDALKEYKQELAAVNFRDFREELYQSIATLDQLNSVFDIDPGSFDALTDKANILKEAIETGLDPSGLALSPDQLATIIDSYQQVQDQISRTFEGAKASMVSFTDYLTTKFFDALMETGNVGATTAVVLSELGASFADVGLGFATDAFREFGKVLAESSNFAEDFGSAIAGLLTDILNLLPSLFIQAGLQLIADPATRAIGLGFIFGGIASSLIAGLTEGAVNEKTAVPNAHGNAFGPNGISAFATGGAFSNSVVNSPTPFLFGNGGALGVMGEAGPEAILPLTRTSSGNLGVEASGSSGSHVSIKIINNTGAEVSTSEKETPDGKEIEVLIGSIVNNGLSSGKFDKAMNSRFNTKAVGINY